MKVSKKIPLYIQEHLGIFLLGFILFFTTLFLQYHSSKAQLYVKFKTNKTGSFKIFWYRGDSGGFSNKNSKNFLFFSKKNEILVELPPFSQFDRLRIDPNEKESTVILKELRLLYPDGKTIDLLPKIVESTVTLKNAIEILYNKDGPIKLKLLGSDPYFELTLPFRQFIDLKWQAMITALLLYVGGTFFLLRLDFLNKSKKGGILQIIVPQENHILLSRTVGSLDCSVGLILLKTRKDSTIYRLEIDELESQSVTRVITRIKDKIPEAVVSFQYNRSCEI